ncbi:hypothetical protein TCAL_10153 [Tigriopus californicus]|uniref:Sulfotransferase domain-containing protein n=1 Tax=Tigriopus californicus TaxID=6832 RepID=A0A553PF01_TIGCA|nr:hypothetical protein TCAL_10153 [Tigriopus californicus]
MEKREAILSLHSEGKTCQEIARTLSSLKVTKSTAWYTTKRYKDTGTQELQEVANLWLQNASANPRKVLILTTWRSGSTFFGELLNQFPGSYYFFEPLIEQHVQRAATNSTQMDILEHLFNCNYQDIRYSKESKWILRHNSRLMPICKKTLGFKEEDLCLDSDFLSKVCALFPIRLMKTVRLETRNVEDLMKKLPGLKVISLIRDPRGIVASRERMPWCSRPQCSDVQHVCERYNRDVESSFEFRSKFSERFMVVRYEDMSLNLYRTVQRVSEFLDFSLSEKIISYIQNHTNLPQFRARKGHDMSLKHSHGTFRNTKSHTFEWRSTIKSEALNQTQQLCASGMNRMGYKLVPSIGVLHNPNIKLMDQIY